MLKLRQCLEIFIKFYYKMLTYSIRMIYNNGEVIMNRDDTEPCYVISVAARILGVQTYTLRYYERIGIIEPRRSQGNTRLYSERDITLLRRAKALVDDMGVNLAGVEVILRMMQRMSELQNELAKLESEVKRLGGGE
jgi:MerR family transcriptional regulator/heat shock protein HspR